ncbi:porin [Microvirgula aerodenitrificans]|uniref:porin n=1 Tax=Microvirgula aerodenitrificans TaxID=57480 RepID=UPI00248D60FD|nr:porin [Microvirgula aerodenitrificans]
MKKLIALAVAALPLAAMADVTLYGNIEASVEGGKSNGYGFSSGRDNVTGEQLHSTKNLKSGVRIDDTGSYIGFKGNEDLGNGLKAIWQVEQGLNIDGTTGSGSGNGYNNTWATRDSFVGLTGDFGTVRLGRLSTYLNSDMEKYDAWIYGAGVNGATITSANTLDGRINNAVRYDSPNIAGFKFTALYGADEQREYASNNTRTNKNIWNLGLGYENSGYFVDASYVGYMDQNYGSVDDGTSDKYGKGDKNGNYWRIEGGYNANNLLVAAAYGQSKLYGTSSPYFGLAGVKVGTLVNGVALTEADIANAEFKTQEAALTLGYTIGAFTPKFTYARVWDIKANGNKIEDNALNQYVVGVDYALSKRTTTYASYGYVDHKANDVSSEQTFAVGVQHKF